jgi:uncharacterized protein (TIGR03437 family)
MVSMRRALRYLLVACVSALALSRGFAQSADVPYIDSLPTGERWLTHLNNDLLPFWTMPAALGNPLGEFPSVRCDDGTVPDLTHPCPPIAGNSYLLTPARYLVPMSRQSYGYGVAFHLTGNPTYLAYMKAGIDYIRRDFKDPSGGMFLMKDLTTGGWGPQREYRDPQQLGYGLLGMAFYYYLTRDEAVLQDILAIKDYIFDSYYNQSLGTVQWLLEPYGGMQAHSKQLVSDLDQMNTYLVLLTPILPEPYQSQWKQTLTMDAHSMLGTFYSPGDNLFFTQADTPQQTDLAYTGADTGHTSKALWLLRWTGMLTGDQGLANFAEAGARRLLDRAYLPEDGSWAQGVLPGGTLDKNKNWWIYCELDQLSGSLALADVAAGQYLPQTNNYWFTYFVDPQYGEVWNGVNYGTNTPQRDMPKSWQWKSAYHDFEHALVGYITSQWLHGQPATLHYAFSGSVDQSTIHPYFFSGTIDSLATTQDGYQTVTFHPAELRAAPAVTVTSGASFLPGPLAAGAIATAWGTTAASVSVTDSTGATRPATVFYSGQGQVNFLMPADTAEGAASVAFTAADGTPARADAQITRVAPGIFQLNSTALAAANVVRVKPDQTQVFETVYQLDASNNVLARPIDVSSASDAVYLTLYATGVQKAASVAVSAGGQSVPVLYAGAQGFYAGLDQVNAGPLPRTLSGRGRVNIILAADGQTANPVQVVIQ